MTKQEAEALIGKAISEANRYFKSIKNESVLVESLVTTEWPNSRVYTETVHISFNKKTVFKSTLNLSFEELDDRAVIDARTNQFYTHIVSDLLMYGLMKCYETLPEKNFAARETATPIQSPTK